MYRKSKKLLAWSLVVCLVITQMLFTNLAFAASSGMVSDGNSNRLAGADRYQTAVAISKAQWTTSDYAVLAYGEDFPDALAAGPLAKKYNAPVLLTDKAALNSATLAEMQRLKVKTVFIVGGEGVVSPAVADAITAAGMTFERLAGADRYATALAVANKVGTTDTVVLAYGENYPDALSVSAIAAAKGWPILLTDVKAVSADVKAYIGTKKVYVVGGTGVVSNDVFNQFTGAVRLGGADRYATNVAVLSQFAADLNFLNVFVATGEGFADALAGSALAAQYASPVVLVDKSLPSATSSFIAGKVTSDSDVIAFGGAAVVPDSVVNAVVALITGGKFTVSSVAATTDMLDKDFDGKLGFTVNGGKTTTLEELDAAGYVVKFTASEDVFENDDNATLQSNSGSIDPVKLAGFLDDSFDYSVVITKDGEEVANSGVQTVDVVDKTETALVSGISDYKVVKDYNENDVYGSDDDAVISSGVIAAGETLYITNVKGTTFDGLTRNIEKLDAETSDASVLTVEKLEAQAIKDGGDAIYDVIAVTAAADLNNVSATVKIKSGNASKDITFTVKDGDREEKTATTDVSSLKLATGTQTGHVQVVVKDQYGDPFQGYEVAASPADGGLKDADDDYVVARKLTDETTNKDGKATVTLEAVQAGSTTLKFDRTNGINMAKVAITVGANGPMDSSKLKLEKWQPSTELKLDENVASTVNKSVSLAFNMYTEFSSLLGPMSADTDKTLGIESGDAAVYDATANDYTVYAYQSDKYSADPAKAIDLEAGDITLSENNPGEILVKKALAEKVDVGKNLIIDVRKGSALSVSKLTITIVNSSPVVSGVAFRSDLATAQDTMLLRDILPVANVTYSGKGGDSKVRVDVNDADQAVYYIETANEPDGYDSADILLGYLTAVGKSGDFNGKSYTFVGDGEVNDGKDIYVQLEAGKGDVQINFYKPGVSTVYKSTTVKVNSEAAVVAAQ